MEHIIFLKGRSTLISLFVIWTCFYTGARGQSDIEDYLEKMVQLKSFSGPVLVAIDDSVLLNKGFGFADLENKIRNTDTTVHRVRSLTKPFTDPKMLRDWWGVETSLIEKKIGGACIIAWQVTESGIGYVSTGTIKNYDPNRELVIGDFVYLNPEKPFLGPIALTGKAGENHGVSDVYLCQDGYRQGYDRDWYYQVVKEAWPMVMQEFKKYLETKG